MFIRFILFVVFLGLTTANVIPKFRNHGIEGSNDLGTPCSTNISNLWINIILMIDVSTNMGAANLKQITLSLASEFTKIKVGTIYDRHTARVLILTYADKATVIANMTALNNGNDVSKALLSLQISNTTSAFGMTDAFEQANAILAAYDMCTENCGIDRHNAFVIVGASSNNIGNTSQLWFDAQLSKVEGDSVITINFNPKDANLATIFNNISSPSMNFTSSDKNFYSDLTWALTQTNCYCGAGEIEQFTVYNSNTSRWERYADCYMEVGFQGFSQNTTFEFCSMAGAVPAAVTSLAKHKFLEDNVYNDVDNKYYIGLHRDDQNNWVWWDFDGSEFPLGSYTPWASGYNASSPGGCVCSTSQPNSTIWDPVNLWTPTSCDVDDIDMVDSFMCQTLACDTDRDSCTNLIPAPPSSMQPKMQKIQLKTNKIVKRNRRANRNKKNFRKNIKV